jgi:2-oxoisovalerate dehydrogenase E1 component
MTLQSIPESDRPGLYRALLLPRLVEEKMLRLLRQGTLSKWFSGIGQEAIAVGVAAALHGDDWILPLHRNLGVFTTRGVDLERLFRQLLFKEGGFTRGRDRTFHFGILDHHIVGMISHLAAMLPVADGLGLAAQLRGEPRVAAAFVGDGGTSEGDFHEAVNLAAVWKLPVIFVVENNQYGLSTPVREQFACEDLASRGVGYGIPGVICDGNDLLAVHRVTGEAARRARRGDGPTLIEFKTFRMRGHEEASGTAYVPPSLFEEWRAHDPIARFERMLDEDGLMPAKARDEIRQRMVDEIEAIADRVIGAGEPESSAERELADVYAPGRAELGEIQGGWGLGTGGSAESLAAGPDVRYVDAISDALRLVLRRDHDALVMGQDVAEYGGVFKVTKGFVEEFGKARIRNTPIIESGAIGAALGLALDGFHPIVEMQYGDFVSCGFNQIVNNLAKTHYRWGVPVPVVLRLPIGGGLHAGPFHSQNVESWFTGVAGLKVVAPATPFDAKGLLIAGCEDGNPVLFLEHKWLYRSLKGCVPEAYYRVPIGRARRAREGADATIVAYGVAVHWATEAADALIKDGESIEVIDLRSLLPWDSGMVLESVKKTGRCLVVHEAPEAGGFGGEVAAVVARDAFAWLDAPVQRLGALDTPVPAAQALEAIFSPKARLLPALRGLLAY